MDETSNISGILVLAKELIETSSSDDDDTITSSSSDDSISDDVLVCLMTYKKEKKCEKLQNYVECVVPGYSRQIFKSHFRMFPETFNEVLTFIGPMLISTRTSSGRKPIDPKKQLLIALWFMATPDSYRSLSVKFGVGKATCFRCVRRVSHALHRISPQVIQWPKNVAADQVQVDFQQISGFPNIIGAIDGTHIKIRAPKIDPGSYVNRKGFHSVSLQGICNAKGLFTHCYVGHAGSVHDARVLRISPVSAFLEDPDEYFPNGTHLIGDAAYPLHQHLMVPFRQNMHLTRRQLNFNHCLSSARMCIERAFALLKTRFRILLDCLPLLDVKEIPEFILACCVLHNICIKKNDVIDVAVIREEEVVQVERQGNIELGLDKRNRIMNELILRV